MLAKALMKFVRLEGEIRSISTDIDRMIREGSNSTTETVLDRQAVIRAIDTYRAGRLSGEDLEFWADYLEMHPLVHYEQGHEQVIATALFYLSSPEVNGPLTNEPLDELLRALGVGEDETF